MKSSQIQLATTFDEGVRLVADDVVKLLIGKMKDYSPKNITNCPIDPKMGVLIRINDKVSRLGNLLQADGEPNNESMTDSWQDIIGYSIIALMLDNGTFTLPLKE